MPNPKRRHSRSRQAMRRATHALVKVQAVKCTNCGASLKPHTVCNACGYYRGRQVIITEVS